ncbi:MAG: sigma-54 factor interaction domain-containing protein [Deltaproteobacteria bacterium]|nr:sigma-54 factor interaction domain-containing protein [Deltaproteobacteria bacterium]
MALFQGESAGRSRLFSALVHANPFTPERLDLERRILGPAFVDAGPAWFLDPREADEERGNVAALRAVAEGLAEEARAGLARGVRADPEGLRRYEDLVLYTLYERFEDRMFRAIVTPGAPEVGGALYEAFRAAYHEALAPAWAVGLPEVPPELAFALLWQLRRGFHFIHRRLLGGSPAAAALRAAVWQSVFTHDLGRYRRGLYGRMHEIPTLILGPSGTGKELVAEAIGASRFIPFDPRKRRFEADHAALFLPVHLAALAESLVEAELFGHDKGAFTGAHQARAGHLEGRDPAFTVFLDEIGEVPLSLQVKLLRVLQTREFFRVGGTEPRRFEGKVIAATHRDLPERITAGLFREDLYYRLCADVVRTPSLRELLDGDAAELERLVSALAARLVDPEDQAALVAEVVAVVEERLGLAYPWPGNIRELEQCIRNILVRGTYQPAAAPPPPDPLGQVAKEFRTGALTEAALLARYTTLVFAQEGSYEGTARRLQIDRRTVKRRVDPDLLSALRAE